MFSSLPLLRIILSLPHVFQIQGKSLTFINVPISSNTAHNTTLTHTLTIAFTPAELENSTVL